MTCKSIAFAAAALVALCVPAQAETELTQISPSIILLGGLPPPPETVPEPAEQNARRTLPDVLADGQRRPAGVGQPVAATSVAVDEQTSAIDDFADEDEADFDSSPLPPLEETELRLGS